MPKRSKGCAPARQSSSLSPHRWGQLAEYAVKFPLVGPRTLLAVHVPAAASCGSEEFRLAVEALPVGADAGVPDEPFFSVRFDHTYDTHEPLKSWAQRFSSILLRFAL